MRTIMIAVAAFALTATTAQAQSRHECQGTARHLESGSVLLADTVPVKLVDERPTRCVLILSGWGIDGAEPNAIFGSGSVNIGDETVDASGVGGFAPPTPGPLELHTQDELWAVLRTGHGVQVITWIELFD